MVEKRRRMTQAGITMVEVLVALLLFCIIGLGLTKSAVAAINYQKRTEIANLAKNLAVSKAEELSGVKLDELTSAYNHTETDISIATHEIKFNRTTAITVNADGSRTITISVTSSTPLLPNPVSFSTRFAPWEA